MKKQTLLILLTLFINSVLAAYLKNVPLDLTQPDGTVIHCFVTGDEFHRRVHDKNGYTIVQDPASGYYVFAGMEGERLAPTPYIVGQADPVETELEPGYDVPPAKMEAKRQNQLKSATAVAASPTTGEFNNIVIFIRFSDQEPLSMSAGYLDALFNSSDDLSLKYYFREVSNNQLNVSSRFFPEPEKDRIFEYQDSHPRSYYSPYHETSNPDGYVGNEGMERDHVLLKKSIEYYNDQIIGSGINFDSNEDGIIDNIIFVIQGDADNWGNVLWPKAFSLDNFMIGSKKVGKINKNFTGMLTLGIICHEFFHSLGAPDLYRYTNQEIQPVGAWDIMGTSMTTHSMTYMKWRYGKWFDEIPEITAPGTYTLEPVSQNPFACYKIPSPGSSKEYFIVEYRKKEGLLESSLPWNYQEGLIIYRINIEALSGNGGGPPDEVFVFRPDGNQFTTGKIDQASFSANESRIAFNSDTNPSCLLSNDEPGGLDISDISFAGDVISFKLNKINPLPKPADLVATEENGEIHITWNAPPSAGFILQGYNLYVEDSLTPFNSSPLTETRYTYELSEQKPYYNFYLTALYNEGESNPVKVTYINSSNPFISDSLALVALYNQCDGAGWRNNENWLEGPLDTWYGVTVEDSRVTSLNLAGSGHESFGLENVLPEELGSLSALQTLNLSYNALEGEIPDTLYSLELLRELDLSYNRLTGEISGDLKKLSNLESLILEYNLIQGKVPSEISSLKNLMRLNLSTNDFSGTVLEHLDSSRQLTEINLRDNQFSGTILPSMAELTNLVTLNLSDNLFSGPLPDIFGELTGLMYLILDNNEFEGAVPPGVALVPGFRDISLINNKFNAFPVLTNTAVLAELAMDGNRFTFEDIEPNMDIEFARGYTGLTYQDQAKTGKTETKYAPPGKPFTLSVYCGGEYNQYQWFKDSVPVTEVTGSPEFTVENVVEGDNGEYHCEVTNTRVMDLTIESHPVTLIGSEELFADAGPDFAADEGALVTLDATASNSSGNTPLIYKWTAPEGIELSGEWEAQPSFRAPSVEYDTEFIFSLVVNDGTEDSAPDEVAVTVRNGFNTPVANAGPDQSVDEGEVVSLDGSGSYVPDGSELSYSWTAPEGIELLGDDEAGPSFTAPKVDSDTEFIFTLVVTGREEVSATDEVVVTVQNFYETPVANAGPDQTVDEGTIVSLDGNGSHVSGFSVLQFSWTAPEGIELTGADDAQPSFTAPEVSADTQFIFTLVVKNGVEISEPDEIVVTVRNITTTLIANAGPAQTVEEGDVVSLDGTGSEVTNGGEIAYSWTAPEGIELSDTGVAQPSFKAPEVHTDSQLIFTLVVISGEEVSAPDEVVVTVRNISEIPVADAGPNQTVEEGDVVSLDGSGSNVSGGGELSYMWTAPEGIELTGADDVRPSFTAPEIHSDSQLVFTLVVTCADVVSAPDEVVVTVLNILQIPVADAGPDQTVDEGAVVLLDGSGSNATGGGELSYMWTAPEGIELTGAENVRPSFTAPEVNSGTEFTFTLVVSSGEEVSTPDEVVVTVQNIPQFPVADAGPYQTVNEGEIVTLDGSGSYVSVGELTYLWNTPEGIELSEADVAKPYFTAPEVNSDTTLIFTLVVTSGEDVSDTASVEITIRSLVGTGISSPISAEFIVFPNPSAGVVNIRFSGSEFPAEYRLAVISASGAAVMEEQLHSSGEYQFDLSDQPAGIYYIRLIHKRQSYYRKLILY